MDEAVQNLHIKISGCFNSCGQHHVADLGFYGVSRKLGGYAVPHFQVVLGGEWEHNAGSYGLPVVAIPSKNIPQVVTRLTERYVSERTNGESFKDFTKRIGKAELKKMLDDLTRPPANDRSFFSDWGDPREYSLGDMGTGECAGEVVSPFEFDMTEAERELFEGQLAFESAQIQEAGQKAYRSMSLAAKALVKIQKANISDDPDQIVSEFRSRFFDTQLFWDPFAGESLLIISSTRTRSPASHIHRIRAAICSTKRSCSSTPRIVAIISWGRSLPCESPRNLGKILR